jgi:Tol biopolymer transport system component
MQPGVAWSGDGALFAFWIWRCHEPGGLFSCPLHSALYVVNLATGNEIWIAGVDDWGGSSRFSPDGRWIAYSTGAGHWYVSKVTEDPYLSGRAP